MRSFMAETEQTKVCPLCAETIKAAAKVCPYCRKSQRRLAFLTRYDVGTIAAIVFLLGAVFIFERICYPRRDFGLDRNKIQVSNFDFAVERSRYYTNVVILGILTNGSEHAWNIEQFEVRFLDRDGKLAEMDDLSTGDFTILPHSDHAFSEYLHRGEIFPRYASYRIGVLSAEDPRAPFWLTERFPL